MALTLVSIDEERRSKPFLRSRTLRRNPTYRALQPDDVKWMYAAYRQGGMRDILPFTLETDQIAEFIEGVLALATGNVVLEARNATGPVGIIRLNENGHRLEILPSFFPWATPRNVVESLVKFLHDVRRDYAVLWTVAPPDKRLAEVMAAYGVIRRVGTLEHWYGPRQPAALFEGRMFDG